MKDAMRCGSYDSALRAVWVGGGHDGPSQHMIRRQMCVYFHASAIRHRGTRATRGIDQHTYICIHTYIHTDTQTEIHTCIHTYTHMRTYVHTHTYIHTHTHIHIYIQASNPHRSTRGTMMTHTTTTTGGGGRVQVEGVGED